MKNKKNKWHILVIMFLLCLIFIPLTFSKYLTVINKKITLNARQPEYDVEFKRNGLPKGYQEVEYIESTGTQKIGTGYIPKTNTKVELALSFNGTFKYGSSSDTGGTNTFLSSPYTPEWDAFTINFGVASDQGNVIFPWFDKSYENGGAEVQMFTITDAIRTNRNTLTIEPGKVSYGTASRTITRKTADQEDELFIFGNSTLAFNRYNMRVYKMIISEDSDIKGIFIPCYRTSDGEIGLYDIINDEFHTNSGTGTFNKGADVGTEASKNIDGTMEKQHFTYGTAQNLTANTYTKEGYIFNGWNTKIDGSGTSYEDEQEVNNLTTVDGDIINLYAQWEDESYMLETGIEFNSRITDEIMYIIVTDDVAPSGTELTDVSANKDGTVVMWVDDDTMYISSQSSGQVVYANPDSSYLFSCYDYSMAEEMHSIDVSNLDTSRVTNMHKMFANLYNIQTIISLDNFNTSKVTDMSYMFEENNALESLDLSSFNTSKVKNMAYMFQGTNEITELDLSKFDTSKVTDMNSMFLTMTSIETLDLSSFNTTNVTKMEEMFAECSSLKTIFASENFVITNVTENANSVFYSCEEIIGGAGTTWSADHVDKTYAHIDGGTSNPGYFTNKKLAQTLLSGVDFNSAIKGEEFEEEYISDDEIYLYAPYDESIVEIYFSDIDENEAQDAEAVIPVDVNRTGSIKAYKIPLEGEDGLYYIVVSPVLGYDKMKVYANENSSQMFDSFAGAKIIEVNSVDFSNTTNMSMMFSECNNLTNIEFGDINTSKVTDMSMVFANLTECTSIDLSEFDTSNVTDMNYMFSGMSNLEELDLSTFDTANVTNMSNMFSYCESLYEIDLSNFNTSKVTDMSMMFHRLRDCTYLNLASFDTSSVTNMNSMFHYADTLESIYVSTSFNQNSLENANNMFYHCESLIGGNGTEYDLSHIDNNYAYIDSDEQPGYFTLYNSIKLNPSVLTETQGPITVTVEFRPGIVSKRKAGFGETLEDAKANVSSITSNIRINVNKNGYVYAEGIDYKGNKVASQIEITNIITIQNQFLRGTGTEIEEYMEQNPGSINNFEKDDTTDENLRFVGNIPDNYIQFTVNGNEELWRIIGVFDGKIKIMKADTMTGQAYDSNNVDDWSTSSLKAYLNSTYYDTIDDADFIDTNSTWYLGTPVNGLNIKFDRATAYTAERDSTMVSSGCAATTTAAIGLMYISDYGYATENYSSEVAGTLMNHYSIASGHNWIGGNSHELVIDSNRSSTSQKVPVISVTSLFLQNANNSDSGCFRPCLYLKSNVEIYDGEGTTQRPYLIREKN